jgi:hypothetical protein
MAHLQASTASAPLLPGPRTLTWRECLIGEAPSAANALSVRDRLLQIARLLYATVTMAAVVVFVRLWGQMMPTHSYYYSFTWAWGFVPYFLAIAFAKRALWKVARSEQDTWWPTVKQSALIGFTYAINYLGVSSATAYVSGPAQIVASQLPIVVSVACSTLLLKRRYPWIGYLGVLFVIAGGVIQGTEPGSAAVPFSIKWFFIFAMGMMPSAAWTITLEGFFVVKGRDGKTCLLEERLMWSNVALVFWLFAFIPLFGALNQPPLPEFWSNFAAAWRCTTTGTGGLEGDDCYNAHWLLWVTIAAAMLQQHAQSLVSKYDTGMLATLVVTVAPFLGDIAFASPAILGSYQAVNNPSPQDGAAASVCLIGAIFFAIAEFRRVGRNAEAEVGQSRLIRFFARPWRVAPADVTKTDTTDEVYEASSF